jgi:hypothetical protein
VIGEVRRVGAGWLIEAWPGGAECSVRVSLRCESCVMLWIRCWSKIKMRSPSTTGKPQNNDPCYNKIPAIKNFISSPSVVNFIAKIPCYNKNPVIKNKISSPFRFVKARFQCSSLFYGNDFFLWKVGHPDLSGEMK